VADRQIDGQRRFRSSQNPVVEKAVSLHPQLEVARMAAMVCAAARQAALDDIDSALSVAAAQARDSPDRARHIANQVLSRAEIMQWEIARFSALCRGRRRY
jgi:hypothetical protein